MTRNFTSMNRCMEENEYERKRVTRNARQRIARAKRRDAEMNERIASRNYTAQYQYAAGYQD